MGGLVLPTSFNVLALMITGGIVVVGIVLLQSRVIAALISAYASLLVTQTWGAALFGFLTGGSSVFGFSLSLKVEPFVVNAALFIVLWLLFIMLLSFGRKPRLPMLDVVMIAVATAGFVLSTLVYLMSDANRASITGGAPLGVWLVQYHSLFILLPVVVLLFTGLRQREDYR